MNTKLLTLIVALGLSGCAFNDPTYREQLRGALLYNGLQQMQRGYQAPVMRAPIHCWRTFTGYVTCQ